MKILFVVLVMMLSVANARQLFGQDELISMNNHRLPNLDLPTMGGSQFWTDHIWRRSWRIQQNVQTKHWRLIDGDNVRRAWGSRAACEEALQEYVPVNDVPFTHAVVYLHGLMRTSRSMKPVAEAVHQELSLPAIYFEYASTRQPIAEHAAALREFLQSMPPTLKLSFVGHSMGNIVLRHVIGDCLTQGDQATLDRMHSIVMLGPPNQGAAIARQLSKVDLYKWVTGPGGMELGPHWETIESKLAEPRCPFGIVAGHMEEGFLSNPLISEDSDFVVGVEETKLPHATDMLELPQLHSFLMDDPAVQTAVINFIDHQKFDDGR
jgi:pimeloyl-ACP methyl ester carboxylesterase